MSPPDMPLPHRVFPASAGVILMSLHVAKTNDGFPRIRGGDPNRKHLSRLLHWFSPHPRG